MLTTEQHDDVMRLRMTSWRGRLVGYDVSAYLVRGLLIDTGFPHVAAHFDRFLGEHRRKIRGVIVTHWHEDHAGNAALVAERKVPMAIAPRTLAQLAESAASIRFYRRFLWGAAPPVGAVIPPLASDGLRLIETPGHTADHQVAWDEARETLFSGDLFLGVKVRATFPDENPRQLVSTLHDVAALRPKRMFDAHRGPVPDPTSALLAKADWLADTIMRIDAKIDAGWDDGAIQRAVLGRERVVGVISGGEYSKMTFVQAVRRTRSSGSL
jgi:glyoxylase-like metal-dependent hydrolase (beta-lactamase superfamily II)